MKIEPGDLCRIVNSLCGNDGKYVTAVRFLGNILFVKEIGNVPAWEIDPALPSSDGGTTTEAPAHMLVPIHPDNTTDEMLLISQKRSQLPV
jgi:hypothetical protein